jgi:hypothetical protein
MYNTTACATSYEAKYNCIALGLASPLRSVKEQQLTYA